MKEPNMFYNYETEKSLVKPVTRQKTRVIFSGGTTEQHVIIIITCCSVVLPKIVNARCIYRRMFRE